jgi:hypothetical protein
MIILPKICFFHYNIPKKKMQSLQLFELYAILICGDYYEKQASGQCIFTGCHFNMGNFLCVPERWHGSSGALFLPIHPVRNGSYRAASRDLAGRS